MRQGDRAREKRVTAKFPPRGPLNTFNGLVVRRLMRRPSRSITSTPSAIGTLMSISGRRLHGSPRWNPQLTLLLDAADIDLSALKGAAFGRGRGADIPSQIGADRIEPGQRRRSCRFTATPLAIQDPRGAGRDRVNGCTLGVPFQIPSL
jgi:hypothetical protein